MLLTGRSDPSKKGQAISRNSKLYRDRLVSRLAAESIGIRVDNVSKGTTFSQTLSFSMITKLLKLISMWFLSSNKTYIFY